MFEAVERGQKLSKKAIYALATDWRFAWSNCSTNGWTPPSRILIRSYRSSFDKKTERPGFRCYWRDLTSKGQIGLYQSAWQTTPLVDQVYSRMGKKAFDVFTERAFAFE